MRTRITNGKKLTNATDVDMMTLGEHPTSSMAAQITAIDKHTIWLAILR